jgi:hypothetical protein
MDENELDELDAALALKMKAREMAYLTQDQNGDSNDVKKIHFLLNSVIVCAYSVTFCFISVEKSRKLSVQPM